jgi:hypothetical protein
MMIDPKEFLELEARTMSRPCILVGAEEIAGVMFIVYDTVTPCDDRFQHTRRWAVMSEDEQGRKGRAGGIAKIEMRDKA